jgi:hypothetical protein
MGRFLQGWSIASAVILLAVAASGLLEPAWLSQDSHVLAGYLGTVVVLFSHTISMFYFIGTGSAVKGAAKERAAKGDRSLVPLWEETKVFKGIIFPKQMLAMTVLMTASILGAGALTNVLPAWIHWSLEVAAVVLNLWALLKTASLIEKNILLMNTANDILIRVEEAEAAAASGPAAGAARDGAPAAGDPLPR